MTNIDAVNFVAQAADDLHTGKTTWAGVEPAMRDHVVRRIHWYVEVKYPADLRATTNARRKATLRREAARWAALLAEIESA